MAGELTMCPFLQAHAFLRGGLVMSHSSPVVGQFAVQAIL